MVSIIGSIIRLKFHNITIISNIIYLFSIFVSCVKKFLTFFLCLNRIFVFFVFSSFFRFFSIKNTGQETSIQIYCRLATLLFVDWLPQVNGFVASFFVYSRESNLWNKKCLHRFVLNNFNHLLIEKKVRLLLFLKL